MVPGPGEGEEKKEKKKIEKEKKKMYYSRNTWISMISKENNKWPKHQ